MKTTITFGQRSHSLIGKRVVTPWTVYKERRKWAMADNRTANNTDPWIPAETEKYSTLGSRVKKVAECVFRYTHSSLHLIRFYIKLHDLTNQTNFAVSVNSF